MVCVPSPLQLLPRMSSVLLLLLLLPFSVGNGGSQPEQALPRRRLSCVRCCGPSEQPVSILSQRSARMSGEPRYSLPKIQPTIDITILKGGCSSFPAWSLLLFLWAFPAAKIGPKIQSKGQNVPKSVQKKGAQNVVVHKGDQNKVKGCPKCGCAQNEVKECPNVPQNAKTRAKGTQRCPK